MAWLLNLLKPIFSWIVGDVLQRLVSYIKDKIIEHQEKKKRELEQRELLRAYHEAKTPKEKEDAFKRLVDRGMAKK